MSTASPSDSSRSFSPPAVPPPPAVEAADPLSLLRAVLEAVPDALLVTGPDGRTLLFNAHVPALWGVDAAALDGTDDAARLELFVAAAADPEGCRRWVKEVMARPESSARHTVSLRGGAVLECHTRPSPLDGGAPGRVWSFRDISGSLRAEQELRQAKELVEAFLDTLPDEGWLKGLDGRYLAVNDPYLRARGLPREQIVGRTDHDLFPAPVADEFRRVDAEVLARGERVVFEEACLRPDGTPCWMEIVKAPFRDASGVPAGIIGLARDITLHRRSEEAARRGEEQMRLILRQIPALFWSVDPELRVTELRGAALRELDVADNEITGQHLLDLLGTDNPQHPAVAAHLAALRGASRSYQTEWRGRVFDAHVRPLHDADGKAVGILGLGVDITERVRLGEQLVQSQKMEAVGRLAGGVAHDFNNLLTVIGGHADLLLMDLAPGNPLRADLEEIKRASERAAGVTRQLLAFSRRQVLRPETVDINERIREMERMVGRLLGEDVALEVTLEDGPIWTRVDPGQLEQVILNLAVNARDAMPSGGRLAIATHPVTLSAAEAEAHPFHVTPGSYGCVRLRDDGVGMDEETLSHLFEPFYTTKGVGRGSGLGLAMVYGIVKQSGGYIWVRSQPGSGAEFSILLPAEEGPSTPGGADDPAEAGSRAGTILLVEDEEAVRSLARRILQRAGYTVLEAENGAQALRLCQGQEERVDLLVTDVVMPGISGRVLAEQLHELRPELPVLFISGYTDGRLLTHGVTDARRLLQKPFEAHELLDRVGRLLAER